MTSILSCFLGSLASLLLPSLVVGAAEFAAEVLREVERCSHAVRHDSGLKTLAPSEDAAAAAVAVEARGASSSCMLLQELRASSPAEPARCNVNAPSAERVVWDLPTTGNILPSGSKLREAETMVVPRVWSAEVGSRQFSPAALVRIMPRRSRRGGGGEGGVCDFPRLSVQAFKKRRGAAHTFYLENTTLYTRDKPRSTSR